MSWLTDTFQKLWTFLTNVGGRPQALYYNFPRVHTAIAEWIACLLFICLLPRRFNKVRTTAITITALPFLLLANMIGEQVSGIWWILDMVVCVLLMLGFLMLCCRVPMRGVVYVWGHAFIAAEFAAALDWQICCFFIESVYWLTPDQFYIVMAITYLIVFGILFLLLRRFIDGWGRMHVAPRETTIVVLIVTLTFLMSNVHFMFRDSVLTQLIGYGILYARTLFDLGGLLILIVYNEMRREIRLRYQLEAMQTLYTRQYEQYQQFSTNNAQLHRVYHDLKHQIEFIRAETDEQKKHTYLAEMERIVNTKQAEVDTGNPVLDTLLSGKMLQCIDKQIDMTCYADGARLEFMDVMDICSLLGNAIDNAMEHTASKEEPKNRLIKVNIHPQNGFMLISVMNYCSIPVDMKDGILRTTKGDTMLHGYGVISIKHIVEKYSGSMVIEQKDNWFVLHILLPIPEPS